MAGQQMRGEAERRGGEGTAGVGGWVEVEVVLVVGGKQVMTG